MTLPLPTEEVEQRIFVEWLRLKRLPHFRVPNETYTKSWSQKAKNKALGVVAGVPDLFVVIPGQQVIGIEMKRVKGGSVTKLQKQWQDTLTAAGVSTFVCRGAEEAIKLIQNCLPAEAAGKNDTIF